MFEINGDSSFLRGLSDEEIDALELWCRIEAARWDDGPEGFGQFYRLVFGRELPRHAREEWLPAIYEAKGEGKGTVIEAFRGSTKTTTLTIAWVAFNIGHHPEHSNLLIQVGDDIARDNTQQIADIIAYNEGWRMAFPHVRPDRQAGWSSTGYDVKRTDMDYADWRRLCTQMKGKDPTFVGLGYRSRAVIGKHPTGVLLVDDIHDENNTRSARELETVRKILMGTILPTVTPETWQVFVGTPWTLNDVLAYLKSTGRFRAVRTPIMRSDSQVAEKSEGREVEDSRLSDHKTTGQFDYWTPVWPERFPLKEIEKLRRVTGEVEFARMFLLDLEAASGVHLRREWLKEYPHEKIDPQWPVVMGVDYASTADQLVGGRRDYFAVAIGRALPGGAGVVLVDGFRGHVSQGGAEEKLKQLAEEYPTTQLIGVEAVGKGEEFFYLMLRTSRLPVRAVRPGRQSKGERFEIGMAPLFEIGRAWVADAETSFLQVFKEEWVRWPHGEHDDTLDAAYWMLYVGAPHMVGNGMKRKRGERPFEALRRG